MNSTKTTRLGVGVLLGLSVPLMATSALPGVHAAGGGVMQSVNPYVTPCQAMLGYWQSYAAKGGRVIFNLATNVSNPAVSSYVSYAEGGMVATADSQVIAGGSNAQYFSDRTYSPPPASSDPSTPVFNITSYPFDNSSIDRIGVMINTHSPSVTFTLLSWGSTQVTVPSPNCAYGVLYGFTTGNPSTMVTMTFKAGGIISTPR